MTLARLARTVRYLPPNRIAWRLINRGRRSLAHRFPAQAAADIERTADALPPFDPFRPALKAAAEETLLLQRTVYADGIRDIFQGRFTLLNRTFDFGAAENIDWRGDFTEGDNPLRRMVLAYMGYAPLMAADAGATGVGAAADLVRDLERAAPLALPGVHADIWHPYAASHRLINLSAALALAPQDANGRDCATLRHHIRCCAAVILRGPERELGYNHLMKNLTALSVYAAGYESVPRPFGFLENAVPASLAECTLPDGGHVERSPMYHALALMDVRTLSACGLFPAAWYDVLNDTRARMERALGAMTHPDGEIALFNDSWIGEAPTPSGLGVGPADGVTTLPDTGYAKLAGGGDAIVFDCGDCGPDDNPAHAHADFLSVELSVGGARFLVDTGVPTYTAGEARDASRSAHAHNGPAIHGAEPLEFWKSFRVGRRGRAHFIAPEGLETAGALIAAGRQTGYAHVGTDVRRAVALWPGQGCLIADSFSGSSAGDGTARLLIPARWHSDDGTNFTLDHKTVRMKALLGGLEPAEPADHWHRYDVAEPAHAVTLKPSLEANHARIALWIGWGAEQAPAEMSLDAVFDALEGAG